MVLYYQCLGDGYRYGYQLGLFAMLLLVVVEVFAYEYLPGFILQEFFDCQNIHYLLGFLEFCYSYTIGLIFFIFRLGFLFLFFFNIILLVYRYSFYIFQFLSIVLHLYRLPPKKLLQQLSLSAYVLSRRPQLYGLYGLYILDVNDYYNGYSFLVMVDVGVIRLAIMVYRYLSQSLTYSYQVYMNRYGRFWLFLLHNLSTLPYYPYFNVDDSNVYQLVLFRVMPVPDIRSNSCILIQLLLLLLLLQVFFDFDLDLLGILSSRESDLTYRGLRGFVLRSSYCDRYIIFYMLLKDIFSYYIVFYVWRSLLRQHPLSLHAFLPIQPTSLVFSTQQPLLLLVWFMGGQLLFLFDICIFCLRMLVIYWMRFSVMFLFIILFYLCYIQYYTILQYISFICYEGTMFCLFAYQKIQFIIVYSIYLLYKYHTSQHRSKMKALRQTILLGIFFLILVTTYSSFSFIVTYMYKNKKDGYKQMGPVLLFVNYFVFLVSNSFAPSIRISLTSQMKIAAFCYTLNYVSQAFQLPGGWGIAFSCIGAMIGGYGAALLWVCYGAYMKNLCKINNEEQIQGKYFSILNGIAFASLLLGAVVTTYCLQYFSDQVYFIILSSLGAFSLIFCQLFIKPIPHRHDLENAHHDWILQLKRNLRYYKKMTALIPTLIYDGLVLGFISTSSTNLMPQKSQKFQIGVFLIILGIGCILGGFLSGRFSDALTMRNAGRLAIMIILASSILTVLALPYLNKPIAFILGFLWGFSRQYIQGWLYVACSRNYNGRLQSYANMKQLHSLSFCLYQVLIIVTKLKIDVVYLMLIFIVLSPICFYYLNKLPMPVENIQQIDERIQQNKSITLQSSSQDSNS